MDASQPQLDVRSRELRHRIIDTLEFGGRGHLGPAFSLVEILRVLYDDVLKFRADDPDWEDRDRFILSKGHGCIAQYVMLADKGFFPAEELHRFCHPGAMLGGHPEARKIPGVEASTGSLGHGLSIGVGMALAARMNNASWRTFVVLGDGESNEGSVWEAALAASKHGLDNLTVIIDYNKFQSYGGTREVLDMEPMKQKWEAFGFDVCEIDGHNVEAIRERLSNCELLKHPTCIICHTVKGKGVDFTENNPRWHHQARVPQDELAAMRAQLEI